MNETSRQRREAEIYNSFIFAMWHLMNLRRDFVGTLNYLETL